MPQALHLLVLAAKRIYHRSIAFLVSGWRCTVFSWNLHRRFGSVSFRESSVARNVPLAAVLSVGSSPESAATPAQSLCAVSELGVALAHRFSISAVANAPISILPMVASSADLENASRPSFGFQQFLLVLTRSMRVLLSLGFL